MYFEQHCNIVQCITDERTYEILLPLQQLVTEGSYIYFYIYVICSLAFILIY